jgi:redox-sensing transcriptional repressor
MPTYLSALVDLAAEEYPHVSSDHLARLVGANPATVRRDLAALDISGTRGLGYDVKYLLHEISVALGLSQDWGVVIVGAGNLGRALANHEGLTQRGFPVRAILDIDPALVGQSVGELSVEHVDDLGAIVADRGVSVGVIATPAQEAQRVADLLESVGIRSILNFTSTALVLDEQVQVRRVDLATELQILSFYQTRTSAARAGTGLPLEGSDGS